MNKGEQRKKHSEKIRYEFYSGGEQIGEIEEGTYHDASQWLLRDCMKFNSYTFRRKNKIAFLDSVSKACEMESRPIDVRIEFVAQWVLECYEVKKKRGLKLSNRDKRIIHYKISKMLFSAKGFKEVTPLRRLYKDGKR